LTLSSYVAVHAHDHVDVDADLFVSLRLTEQHCG